MQTDSKTIIPRGAQFHESIATRWGANYGAGSFKRRLELFNSILDRSVGAGQYWLDLGCGSGVLTAELIARGARVVAVDGSPSMLAAASKILDMDIGKFVTFRHGDAQDLSWASPCSFDGVLCSSVLEYVDDQDELIIQVSRALKDNGVFVTSVPPKRSPVRTLQKALRLFFGLFGIDKYGYLAVSRFEVDPRSVAGWLRNVGLRVERVSDFDPLLPTFILNFFRPSLLIIEARKTVQSESGEGFERSMLNETKK